ncbi:Multidrug resistance-associated protein 5 [Branchiostoma belcheri]|nr:Multidrug resistance-associated protein 5 [Branchiostoma belcheri]
MRRPSARAFTLVFSTRQNGRSSRLERTGWYDVITSNRCRWRQLSHLMRLVGAPGRQVFDNVPRSPWFSHVTASIQGLSTIHAYHKNSDVMATFTTLMDKNNAAFLMYHFSTRWLAVRLDTVSLSINVLAALMVVVFQGQIPPSWAGLALSYAIQNTDRYPSGCRQSIGTLLLRYRPDEQNKDVYFVNPVQDIVREAAGYLPGACRRTTNKGDKMPLKETFNCDHNNRCPPGSRARREPGGATSPTGTGAIGTEA